MELAFSIFSVILSGASADAESKNPFSFRTADLPHIQGNENSVLHGGSKEAPYDPPVHSPVGMRRLFRAILRNIYIPFIAIGEKMDYTRCITRKERHPPWKKTA